MITLFKFLQDNENKYNRAINANLYVTTQLDELCERFSGRLRWVPITVSRFRFRIYTHHSKSEIRRSIMSIILPFIYEPNDEQNRNRLLNLLRARFHGAQLIN